MVSVKWTYRLLALTCILNGNNLFTKAFECFSCSYTVSSDTSVDYECVNNVNVVDKLTCVAPYVCKTIALFDPGRASIRSVTRNCLPKGDHCNETYCCTTDGLYPLCEQQCHASLCNSVNPETWLTQHGLANSATTARTASQVEINSTKSPSGNISKSEVKLPASLFDVSGEIERKKKLHKSWYYEIAVICGIFAVLALLGKRE